MYDVLNWLMYVWTLAFIMYHTTTLNVLWGGTVVVTFLDELFAFTFTRCCMKKWPFDWQQIASISAIFIRNYGRPALGLIRISWHLINFVQIIIVALAACVRYCIDRVQCAYKHSICCSCIEILHQIQIFLHPDI